jgi:LPS export ABC transporter protein LptC
MKILPFGILIVTIAFLFSCKQRDDVVSLEEYEGPAVEAFDIITLYSDSARVKLKLVANRQLEFTNGDREFPEGLYLEFYENDGSITSTMRADYCYYTKEDDLYKATGDVVIKGVKKKELLNTEELFWNQKEEMVFTEKFVRIEKDGEIHMGDGLEAKQDFSEYRMLKSRGTILLEDEEEDE